MKKHAVFVHKWQWLSMLKIPSNQQNNPGTNKQVQKVTDGHFIILKGRIYQEDRML